MAHDVFVSYASEDKQRVASLVHFLEADGFRCWYAPRDVLPGANYGAQIADAIRSTRILILLLSSHSNQSMPVSNEVERAMHNGVVVMPIRIEDVLPSPNLELHIAGAHWLDALIDPIESHQEVVVRAVRKHLEAIGAEPARPPRSSRSHTQSGSALADAPPAPQWNPAPNAGIKKRSMVFAVIAGAVLVGMVAGTWFLTRQGTQGNSIAAAPREVQDSEPLIDAPSPPVVSGADEASEDLDPSNDDHESNDEQERSEAKQSH